MGRRMPVSRRNPAQLPRRKKRRLTPTTAGTLVSRPICGSRECTARWVRSVTRPASMPASGTFSNTSTSALWELWSPATSASRCRSISCGMKLSDDKGLAFDQGPTSVKIKATETLLTPKVAYRIVNGEKIKVDGNFGIRYWHLGEDLSFQPPGILRNVSQSVNWVDVIAGARIEAALSPKVLVTVLGDAGGGGANSDYQVAGFLGYRLKPNVTLQGGWRYLDVNYRPGGPRFLYNTATSGLMLGVTFNVK